MGSRSSRRRRWPWPMSSPSAGKECEPAERPPPPAGRGPAVLPPGARTGYFSLVTRPPVYLDHAATTPVRPEVLEAMLPYLTDQAFGNPSSAHRFGRTARAGLEQARREVAQAVGTEPNQVIFTSGGTEADNLAIVGAALAARERGSAMCAVVSAIEHKAILAAAHAVCHLGGREVVLPVDREGRVELDALDEALQERPAVVSVMWVNNEVGVIQPVAEIARRCCDAGVAYHTD